MAKVDVLTAGQKKKKGGALELEPSVFEAPVRPHLFHAEVRRQLASRRAGTHATKNRSMVSGGGAKPWRQKGTGRARQGSSRSPQWAGGGAVFGPVPRAYEHALPKKARRAALRGALSLRLREGAFAVVDELSLPEIKTKRLLETLGTLGFGDGESVLLVLEGPQTEVERSARNVPWLSTVRVEGLNTYDVLRHRRLLATRAAVAAIQARLGGTHEETTA